MRSTSSLIAFFGFVAVLLAVAAGTYAFDRSRADVIAEGVHVQGIDVGGLTTAQARRKLERELVEPLARPLVVRYKDRRYRLSSRRARVGVDVDRSLSEALRRSRNGNIIARTAREITGDRILTDLPVKISYDPRAVDRLVERITNDLNRPARDARVDIGPAGVSTVPSRTGLRVKDRLLERSLESRLASFGGSRTVRVRTETVHPEQSSDRLADQYPAILIVDRRTFRLRFYKHLKLAKTYVIAVGKVGMETPAGRYAIQNKQEQPAWHVPDSDWAGELRGKVIPPGDPRNPIKARWMGIYNGAGIHGTDAEASLGSAASHGCVRMRISDVKELYDQVPVGAPVFIS